MILGTYDESYGELREDEFLLKIREENQYKPKTGFLTKLTKKCEVPVKFKDWDRHWNGSTYVTNETIYVWQETFRSGWSLVDWRIGKSQEWAIMKHPEGFTVEIYLNNFLTIIQENTVERGVIHGEFKWEDNKLIKKS